MLFLYDSALASRSSPFQPKRTKDTSIEMIVIDSLTMPPSEYTITSYASQHGEAQTRFTIRIFRGLFDQ
ncbi:hypothetical protein [Ruminococcus sp.]|uniref:hypothetical protein n=1 Tax=Ruminococcus sp. TaxID=41978 RepID=UPI0025F9DB95|nr:hypothetical protein [Ruminococcus sp.]MCR4640298.1 hypothetical protein [Ruminococcus sp.]